VKLALLTEKRTQNTDVSKIFRLPKGAYAFGDPGYIFGNDLPDKLWDAFCKLSEDEGCGEVEFPEHGGWFVWGSTHDGDGRYDVNFRGMTASVGVDSGTLGFIPVEFARKGMPDFETVYATIENHHCDLVVAYTCGNWHHRSYGGSVICRTDGDDE
jgi:hypothetical protein